LKPLEFLKLKVKRTLENPVKTGAEGARCANRNSQAKGQSVFTFLFLTAKVFFVGFFVFRLL
jgi:hypothetical protein